MKLYKKLGEIYPIVEENLKYIFNGLEISPESLVSLGYNEYLDSTIITTEIPTLTQEEKIELWVRRARNVLLKESDWTQAADASLTTEQKAAWASYRQELRELTTTLANITSIEEVVFPVKP